MRANGTEVTLTESGWDGRAVLRFNEYEPELYLSPDEMDQLSDLLRLMAARMRGAT
jgi:hypothetical protein